MRKSIDPSKSIDSSVSTHSAAPEPRWLDIERLARVEITSEDPSHPVEQALGMGGRAGWRAGAPGPQTLRLRFDEPQRLERIRVHFQEAQHERHQELVLRWSADG